MQTGGGSGGGGVEEIIFWQNHWNFRFVNLPQKIPDKMKLHPWNFWNLCYTLWKFLGLYPLYPRLVEILHDFFIDHPCKFFFLAPWISTFYLEIPCSQSPPPHLYVFFSEIAHSHSYTDSYISSFWWVVSIVLQKFDTLSKKKKKEIWHRKQHSYLYCELTLSTYDVTCLKL